MTLMSMVRSRGPGSVDRVALVEHKRGPVSGGPPPRVRDLHFGLCLQGPEVDAEDPGDPFRRLRRACLA